jgi:hypothetical protein
VSVDTRTKGRRLDGYTTRRIEKDLTLLVDPDLIRLSVEITVITAGLFGRGLGADVDGVDGAACPIEIVR